MYSEKVMENFTNPRHLKEIKDADGIGKVGNPKCGDLMWCYIKVGRDADGDETIKDIGIKTFGCVGAISSSNMLCEMVLGKKIKDALKITNKDVYEALDKGLPVEKVHCSVLAADALKKAVEDYESKK